MNLGLDLTFWSGFEASYKVLLLLKERKIMKCKSMLLLLMISGLVHPVGLPGGTQLATLVTGDTTVPNVLRLHVITDGGPFVCGELTVKTLE